MFIKKKKKGGFINPAYEKFERTMGIVTFVLILFIFLTLVVWAVAESTGIETM